MQLISQPKYPWFFPDFQVLYIRRLATNVLFFMLISEMSLYFM